MPLPSCFGIVFTRDRPLTSVMPDMATARAVKDTDTAIEIAAQNAKSAYAD
jgi:hypothetical protein